jgi:ABC-type glycerol-3-phosphate transport system substrate-binding protein
VNIPFGSKTFATLICCAVFTGGCSPGENQSALTSSTETGGDKSQVQPVTLRVMNGQGGYEEADFWKYFAEPAKKRFPHITFEFVGKGTNLERMVQAGEVPDIVMTGGRSLAGNIKTLGVLEDHRELAKKHNLNWGGGL